MPTFIQVIKRCRVHGTLPKPNFSNNNPVSFKELDQRFRPVNPRSMRSLLSKMLENLPALSPFGGHPYYRRSKPAPKNKDDFASDGTHIDLTNAHMEPYGVSDPVAEANSLFDKRAAAAVSDAAGSIGFLQYKPSANSWIGRGEFTEYDPFEELLEVNNYSGKAKPIKIPTVKSLAVMAYPDYFPSFNDDNFRRIVYEAILASSPGWCGTFGPGIDGTWDVMFEKSEGNYDMSQMRLLPIAYRYYDELPDEAREWLITQVLGRGCIHRPNLDDTFTSGGTPNDWSRAGFIEPGGLFSLGITHKNIGETENHILMINTARYLTNQLLYQRDHHPDHDNRRNGGDDRPSCTDLMLYLLRNILIDDFSEYNAKPYQHESRTALLNLCSYAYDHEVRLAARMVLDYISAHIAVSSSDLRRMVPFRRRNETDDGRAAQLPGGFMDVGLLEWNLGADPMTEHFAMQAGNTRAYQTPNRNLIPPDNIYQVRPWDWAIASNGEYAVMEVLSDYRLPPSIHDLFVNDLHRRFFQILHRFPQDNIGVTGRNCNNSEIYAGSPSYLITAGGSPATYAVDPHWAGIVFTDEAQQLGVAVTTSFMPTGLSAGHDTQNYARDLIQFSSFSSGDSMGFNYGVAPDFACGHQVHLPQWCKDAIIQDPINTDKQRGKFVFVNKGYLFNWDSIPGNDNRRLINFLKQSYNIGWVKVENIKKSDDSNTISASDGNNSLSLSLNSDKTKVSLKIHEVARTGYDELIARTEYSKLNIYNKGGACDLPGFYLAIFQDGDFTVMEAFDTWLHPGLSFEKFIQNVHDRNDNTLSRLDNNVPAQYKTQNGNIIHFTIWNFNGIAPFFGAIVGSVDYGSGDPWNNTDRFLTGTVMNSPTEGVVEITNQFLGTKITLDMSDKWHPKRTSETGEIEEAGSNHEVWVDFAWKGPCVGDFFRPFNSISAAVAAVADGGVIKIMPGSTSERPSIQTNKRIRFVATIGGVTIGVR